MVLHPFENKIKIIYLDYRVIPVRFLSLKSLFLVSHSLDSPTQILILKMHICFSPNTSLPAGPFRKCSPQDIDAAHLLFTDLDAILFFFMALVMICDYH